MRSDGASGIDAATAIFVKGCLGGAGLALLFLIISGSIYLLLSALNAPRNLLLLASIASGPIIGSALAVIVLTRRAAREHQRMRQIEQDDETSTRDAP